MNNIATINGLADGISFLENSKFEQTALRSDILYNDKEPIDLDLQGIYYDEGYTISEYRPEDFGEAVALLSNITTEEAIIETDKTL